jgi:hypothetical protein
VDHSGRVDHAGRVDRVTPGPDGPPVPETGLCDSCRHQQIVRTTRGSVFSLCRRSRDEPDRFPRYPRLPVLRCPGYQRDG